MIHGKTNSMLNVGLSINTENDIYKKILQELCDVYNTISKWLFYILKYNI